MVLQLDAAHTGHLDVRNYTSEVFKAVRPYERFGRCERMYAVSERPHEAVGRGAYGPIIVDDCDKWKL
jgi:hypothetical protein